MSSSCSSSKFSNSDLTSYNPTNSTSNSAFGFSSYKSIHKSSSKKSSSLRDEIEMRTVKIVDIGYITILYFIFGVIFASLYDKLFGKFVKEEEDKKSIYRVTLELIGIIWLFGVTIYVVRNIVELIPSPLSHVPLSNPKRQFDHSKVKELGTATVFALILFGTSRYFVDKFGYYYDRLGKELNK
jgi:hypothetical protein